MPDRNNMLKCMCGMELLVQFQINYKIPNIKKR